MNENNFDVALIAKNEANTLPRLLKSLEEFRNKEVGGVYLVDTGSTDDTVKIAKEWGCNVIEVGDKFCYAPLQEDLDQFKSLFGFEPSFKLDKKYFHFSDARNFAVSQTKNNFVFQPDADEVVEWDLDKVREAIKDEDHLVYNFVFAWNPDGTPALQFPHCKFYDKTKLHWVKWVHEVPVPLDGQSPKPPKFCDFIKHKHFQEFKESRSSYLPALELSVIRNPNDERNLFYLGREYIFQGQWQNSIQFFEKAIPKIWWLPEKGQAYTYVGDCYKNLGNIEKAKENYLEALKYCDTRREPWFAIGELLSSFAPDDAIPYYSAALAIPFTDGKHGYFNDMNLYGWIIPERLAAMYGRIGDFTNSKKYWEEAMKYNPPKYVQDAKTIFGLPTGGLPLKINGFDT